MINKIMSIFGVNKLLSEELVKKGLERVNPFFKKFFKQTAKYGYPLGATLGFLKSEIGGNKTQQSQENENLRPDEAANLEIKRQGNVAPRLGKAIAKGALGATLGGAAGATLSGIEGLINPSEEQKNQQITTQEENAFQQQPTPKTPFDEFLRQNPELGAYLDKQMKAGHDPIVAATQAKKISKFRSLISQLEEDMGQSFEDLIGYLFYGRQRQETGMKPPQDKGQMPSSGDADILNLMSNILKM